MKNIEVSLNREYILAGDISASMETVDPKCAGVSRYQYMLEKFRSFIRIACDFDPHGGPTIMLFGQNVTKYEHANLEMIDTKLESIKFEGLTMTDLLLAEAFAEHREEKSEEAEEGRLHPGTTLMIFTDGDPTNKESVKREIIRIANSIDRESEFTIIFLTVGTITQSLQAYLSNLESGLKDKAKYQIVSVQELDKVNFIGAASGISN